MTARLPLFYFKPTIYWIDDDEIFTQAAHIHFEKYYRCKSFNNPDVAIDYFLSYQSPLSGISFKREYTESDSYGANNHYPVDINIPQIKDVLNIPGKHEEVAVLIIDFNMPNTDGLELCKKLKYLPIKKILLTGEATLEKAIEAFNLGLIDKFLAKNENTSTILHNYIEELATQHFHDKTSDLISHIEASKPSILSDKNFINFFADWREENNIEEYCLVNKQGSFLVKDKDGNQAYFVAMSQSDINEFVNLNDELLGKIGILLTNTSEGKLIPFFGCDKEPWDIDILDWENHFYPCQLITGRENYYWAKVSKQ